MIYNNILKLIGNTPIIKLKNNNPQVNLYAKFEGGNLGGSIKDRAALNMIREAEKRGELDKKKIILEASSGNMGIALSMIGVYLGYKVKIIMSAGVSGERRKIIKAFGVELILTDANLGTKGALNLALRLKNKNPEKYWFADQFNNPDNWKAHYNSTALEILRDIKLIDYFVAGIGTGGTIIGIAKALKEKFPNIKIISILPPAGYKIQGIQNIQKDFIGKIYNSNLIDDFVYISQVEAFNMLRKLAYTQGLFLGMSSGANVQGAVKISQQIKRGNIVTILPDRGEKYLSSGLF
jgi:cysteine synthase